MSSYKSQFKRKAKKCDSKCEHYFVQYQYTNDGVGYGLYCNKHKFVSAISRVIAEDCIDHGAVCVTKRLHKQILKKMEVQTS